MLLIIFLILLLYIFLIFRFFIGWSNINRSKEKYFPQVSVVLALRNEESEVKRLINDLLAQNYPKEKIEFILVNDHSDDDTGHFLNKYGSSSIKIINMKTGEYGKKNAIKHAINRSKGDIIVATDADCSFSSNWITSIVSYFKNENIKLVSGPVMFYKKQGFFQYMQQLEFLSLIGSGAGSIGINNPIFCNGANMAYRKEIFLEMNDPSLVELASGDDVFLLHKTKEKYSNAIAFAKDEDSIVTTDSMNNFSDFINQRKRWTAKSTRYKDAKSIYTSYIVLLVNLSLIYLFFMSFFLQNYLSFLLIFYIIKFFVDTLFMSSVLRFFKETDLIKWIFPFELLYAIYVVLIVFLSFTSSFTWKNRVYKK